LIVEVEVGLSIRVLTWIGAMMSLSNWPVDEL